MKRDKILRICTIIYSVIVLILSVVYLLTDKMIPGLNPFCVAGLMILLSFNYNITEKTKKMKYLFYIAAGVNIMAGIAQVINACGM